MSTVVEAARGERQGFISSKLNWLRAGVLGANDGIVSIAGLLIGIAAVDPTNTHAIVIAGIAGIASAALSMAIGEYVSVSTQRDTEREIVRLQHVAQSRNPGHAFNEIKQVCLQRGMSEESAHQVASDLSSHEPVNAVISFKYGIDSDSLTSPWAAAGSSFIAFVSGAALPMLTMVLTPPPLRIVATFVSVFVALALTGWISAWLGRSPRQRSVLRLVCAGSAAMIITYAIGRLLEGASMV